MCGRCWDHWPGPIQVACLQQTRNLLAAPALALPALLLMVRALVERSVPVRCSFLRIGMSVLADCIFDTSVSLAAPLSTLNTSFHRVMLFKCRIMSDAMSCMAHQRYRSLQGCNLWHFC